MKEYLFFQNHKKFLPKEMPPGGATPNSDATTNTDSMGKSQVDFRQIFY